jgi:segregation and condensation protein B
MLFVGISQGNLSARRAASLIRGVSPREIEQLVDELNDSYAADGAAFRIQSGSDGYRLALEADLEPVRRQLHGRIREARLGHAAIEVLAVVAYHQPVTLDEIDRLRNRHSGPVLNLLVRRDLVSLERDPENRRIRRYRTTPRFLELFGMESIDDLPQAHSPQGADFLDD